MRILASSARVLRTAVYAAPWAWLVAFGALFTLTVVQFDRFPSYGNPDPKHVAGAWLPYWAIYLLLIPTLVSPLVAGSDLLLRGLGKMRPFLTVQHAIYAAGFALFAAVAFGDAFGLMNWLLD